MQRSPRHDVLLSVHVPKSAGCSLRIAFARALGPRRLVLDYADDPVDPATPDAHVVAQAVSGTLGRLRHARVVHGHFPIQKYDGLRDACRAVMLREPVENLISIYFFWQHLSRSGEHDGHALFRSFCAERPSIIEFARFPTFRYLLSRTFFGDYDMRRFDIVGDFAARADYWSAIERATGLVLDASVHTNRTPRSEQRDETEGSAHVARALRDLLRDDIAFYERWSTRSSTGTAHGAAPIGGLSAAPGKTRR